MRVNIQVQPINASFNRILTDPSTFEELYDYFSFDTEIWKLNPKTGKRSPRTVPFHLLKKRTQSLPSGLYKHLLAFASERNYQIEGADLPAENWSIADTESYISGLQLWANSRYITPYEHQILAITKALRYKRRVLLSSTSSGKSLIAYIINRYLLEKGLRGLIVVPTIGLVNQMFNDFIDYSTKNRWNTEKNVHKIYAGQDKYTKKPITISTWQSIFDLQDPEWFEQFDFVIGDEAHTFAAKSLGQVMEGLSNAHYRIGMSGSLKDEKVHELTIIGHFGPVVQVAKNKELQEKKIVADLTINALVLQYSEEARKSVRLLDYQTEIDWLVTNKYRNNFITNLAVSQKKNTLILFQYVLKHGKVLYDLITQKDPNRPVYFVCGATDKDDRETIRQIVEKDENAIIIASNGVFSTGVSIRNLHAIIFASPTKSKIRVLQSIGRGLRISDKKSHCTLFDIADDLRYEDYVNYSLKHFVDRRRIYKDEEFEVKVYNISLGDKHG